MHFRVYLVIQKLSPTLAGYSVTAPCPHAKVAGGDPGHGTYKGNQRAHDWVEQHRSMFLSFSLSKINFFKSSISLFFHCDSFNPARENRDSGRYLEKRIYVNISGAKIITAPFPPPANMGRQFSAFLAVQMGVT